MPKVLQASPVAIANLILSLSEDLLRRARELALRENTAVNALVRDFLTQYVDARSRRLQALDALETVADRTSSRSDGPWTRESLLGLSVRSACVRNEDPDL